MKLKSILYILMLLPFLWSCNNEDDVEEILARHMACSGFHGKANWDKRNGEPKYNAMAHNPIRLSQPKEEKPWISFMVSTSLSKRMVLLQEAYKMEPLKAHGKRTEKDLTVNINFTKTPPSTSYNNEFIEALNNAIFYQGDSNVLLLAPEGKNLYSICT